MADSDSVHVTMINMPMSLILIIIITSCYIILQKDASARTQKEQSGTLYVLRDGRLPLFLCHTICYMGKAHKETRDWDPSLGKTQLQLFPCVLQWMLWKTTMLRYPLLNPGCVTGVLKLKIEDATPAKAPGVDHYQVLLKQQFHIFMKSDFIN